MSGGLRIENILKKTANGELTNDKRRVGQSRDCYYDI